MLIPMLQMGKMRHEQSVACVRGHRDGWQSLHCLPGCHHFPTQWLDCYGAQPMVVEITNDVRPWIDCLCRNELCSWSSVKAQAPGLGPAVASCTFRLHLLVSPLLWWLSCEWLLDTGGGEESEIGKTMKMEKKSPFQNNQIRMLKWMRTCGQGPR